jgi:inner membrane protein
MFIPALFVSEIINERADYNRRTGESVGQEWGGHQLLSGPVLIVPVEEIVTVREKHELTDPATGVQKLDGKGNPMFVFRDVQKTETRAPVYLYPNRFDATLDSQTEERYRGIFRVPVYRADVALEFDFPTDQLSAHLRGDEYALWDQARVRLHVSSNRALRGAATLQTGETTLNLEPLGASDDRMQGIEAATGDPRQRDSYRLSLAMNGAHSLMLTPSGRESRVTMQSDWPHPSFFGAFLPDSQEISEAGFKADWIIPHLARAVAQIARESHERDARNSTSFGVRLYQPNDFYQKSYRAAHYGVLFIGLTFLTIFLIEGQSKRPVHPVQYILVGLAQSTFFLLMLALSEQMGFATAYLIAASATVALIAGFGAMALHLGRRTWLLAVLQAVLYGVLFLILRSADYALLAGSVLTFAAIAGTMFATRNANWYGAPRAPGVRWFGRSRPSGPAPQVPVPDRPAQG